MTKALVLAGILGIALGTFVTVLTLALSSIIAFVQATHIDIPGVFTVWADSSEGAPGLAFIPNFTGITLMVVIIAVCCMAIGAYGHSRSASR